jgi:transposase
VSRESCTKRAIWGALRNNPVWSARHAHLTSRDRNRLNDGQARTAVAAALLRQLFTVITRRAPWDPAMAGACAAASRQEVTTAAA